ncbi:MAG: helix-turn-helix domain-containing protein [Alphaproteobacteria bacterium]
MAMANPDAQPPPEDLAELRPLVNIKRLREALEMFQEEFARIYGIPLGTLRDWEQRRKTPTGRPEPIFR